MNTKLALIELNQLEYTFYIFGDMISRIYDFDAMTGEIEGKIIEAILSLQRICNADMLRTVK